MIVDSGNFDWVANADRFPGLTQPDPLLPRRGLGGMRLARRLHIRRVRLFCSATPAALSPFNAFLLLQGLETPAAQDGAPQRERAGSGQPPRRSQP